MCCCACTSAPGHPPSDGGRQFSWWPGGGLSSVVASAGKPVHRQARGVRQQLPHGHAWLPAMIGRHLPRNKHVVDGGVQVALGDQAQRAHGCDRLADRACLEQCAWRHRVRTAGLWNPRHRPRPTPRRGSRRCRPPGIRKRSNSGARSSGGSRSQAGTAQPSRRSPATPWALSLSYMLRIIAQAWQPARESIAHGMWPEPRKLAQ
jgi:hypothetical protein